MCVCVCVQSEQKVWWMVLKIHGQFKSYKKAGVAGEKDIQKITQ